MCCGTVRAYSVPPPFQPSSPVWADLCSPCADFQALIPGRLTASFAWALGPSHRNSFPSLGGAVGGPSPLLRLSLGSSLGKGPSEVLPRTYRHWASFFSVEEPPYQGGEFDTG